MIELLPLAAYHFLSSGLVGLLAWRSTRAISPTTPASHHNGLVEKTRLLRLYFCFSLAVSSHIAFDILEHNLPV